MKYFRVKNWDRFQHYKDRTPPWIKLHRDLLRDYDFQCLQDASKLHLMLLWLLASQLDNKIPYDEKWLQNQLGLKSKIDLETLLLAEFIECYQDASEMLASCKQSAIGETETEAETEAEGEADCASKQAPPPPLKKLWNDHCQNLPVCQQVSKARQQHWKSRWREKPEKAYWVGVIEKLASSKFCNGENKRQWKANVDFFLRPDTHIKALEGQYENREKPKPRIGGAISIRSTPEPAKVESKPKREYPPNEQKHA